MHDDTETRWMAAMRRGDFAAARAVSDGVLAARDPRLRDDPSLPYHRRWVWDGRPVDGADVLIRCYHGLGDTLQFARFIPGVIRRAASVAVEAPPALLPLLAGLGGVRLIPFDPARPAPPAGCDIEVMELFQACRPEADRLPPPLPLPRVTPLRAGTAAIGLCWQAGDWDGARSTPLHDLVAAIGPGRTLVSLQRGSAATEATAGLFANPADDSTDLLRTAALIAGASEIVTVDTMVAHLAGSLGASVRLLLRRNADWRWMKGREDTPWYPTMRLYRQEKEGDWSAPLGRLADDIRNPPAG
jgi:hypothetical protein